MQPSAIGLHPTPPTPRPPPPRPPPPPAPAPPPPPPPRPPRQSNAHHRDLHLRAVVGTDRCV
ncbi:hypothetical protein AB2P54_21505 [Acinetobacter baumannii]|uniref:hypothetical protein n=1 Tax=Acinetobacter baumannii TaxID=470 RepID=UPI00346331D5